MKYIKNLSLWMLLFTSMIPFLNVPSLSSAIQESPENKIEQIIDDCLSKKFPNLSFYAFIEKIIVVIRSNLEYFSKKYGTSLVNNLLHDLPLLKWARTPADVHKILEKYKNCPWLTGNNHKKRSRGEVLLGLMARLKIKGKV